MNARKKALLLAFLLLIGIPALFIGLAVLVVRHHDAPWPEPPENVRLEPLLRPLSRAEITETNGYFHLLQCYTEMPSDAPEEQEQYEEEGWEAGRFTNLVATVRQRIEASRPRLDQAVNAEFFQVERLDHDMVSPTYAGVFGDVKGLGLLAHDHASRGEWNEVESALVLAANLSSRFSIGGTVLHQLVGGGGIAKTVEKALELDETYGIPSEHAERITQALVREQDRLASDEEALRHDLHIMRRMIPRIFQNGPDAIEALELSMTRPGSRIWRLLGSSPARTTAHLESVFAQVILAAESDDAKAVEGIREFIDAPVHDAPLSDDPLGRKLLDVVMVKLVSVDQRRQVLVDMLPVMTALRQYTRDHDGAPPARLEELVPDYLEALPGDRFHPQDESFRYEVEGKDWLLYSVGPDRNDGGARWNGFNREERKDHDGDYDFVLRSDDDQRKRDKRKQEELEDEDAP